MTLSAARWAAIKAIFDAVVELAPQQREPLIAAAALEANDLAELESLLSHHDASDGVQGFLAESAVDTLAALSPSRAGQRMGAWEIVRPVGAGGMGEVFEARRADGSFEGRAAVKLLKRGMDSAAVLQRFAQERQTLARLNHPHIARLLDAGASADGLPYFVLEFVDGEPIDLAVQNLALDARLALFLQLADAVAYAHRNLLVHRDLKPGNVFVDRDGHVKLLDFGIAKALDPLDGHDGHTTIGGQRPLTPNYASPEQVRGEPMTTATDIYSLGVLLYQMLTGTRPTGRNATTAAEAARSVLEDAPTRPSRLSAREAIDPKWLQNRKALEGDLDNILLKALEKTTDRRYSSVDAMASDVRAFMAGRPVSARADSALYVLGKFVRRNRWTVLAAGVGGLGLATGLAAALLQGRAAIALGAVGLAAGLVMALLQGRKAEVARARAEQHVAELRQLSRDVVVKYGDAITFVPGGKEQKAAMLATTIAYMDRLALGASGDPAFCAELGSLHARLADLRASGEFNANESAIDAVQHAQRAIELFTAAEADGALDADTFLWWGKSEGGIAKAAQRQGNLSDASLHLEQAEAVLLRAMKLFPTHPGLRSELIDTKMLTVQLLFGYGIPNLGQPEEALRSLSEVDALYIQAIDGPGPTLTHDVFQLGTVASTRALVLARLERWQEAIAAASMSVVHRQRACNLEPHNRVFLGGMAANENLLGALYLDVGDCEAALRVTTSAWHNLDTLQEQDADNQAWQAQRKSLALNHGRALLGVGEVVAANTVLQISADWLVPLVSAGQATPAQCRRLAQTQLAQAALAFRSKDTAAADRLAQTAEDALRTLVDQEPTVREHARVLRECRALREAFAGAIRQSTEPAK